MLTRKSLWQWRPYEGVLPCHKLGVAGDLNARPSTGLISSFINTQSDWFGWQHVIIVMPQHDGKDFWHSYHIGFVLPDGFTMYCRKELKGKTALLIGPGPVSFFGWSTKDREELRLVLVEETIRSDLENHPEVTLI